MKAHDVFPAVCYPDLSGDWRRRNSHAPWHLMCPHEILTVKGYALEDYWGTEWRSGIWTASMTRASKSAASPSRTSCGWCFALAVETGTPFAFNRDSVNHMNPNGHTGMILLLQSLYGDRAETSAPIEHISTEVHTENG